MKLAIITAAAICLAAPAMASKCDLRANIVDKLAGKWGEQLTAGGLQKLSTGQVMVEVWASRATGSFTVMISRPDGTSCIVAHGNDFFVIPSVAEGDPA